MESHAHIVHLGPKYAMYKREEVYFLHAISCKNKLKE